MPAELLPGYLQWRHDRQCAVRDLRCGSITRGRGWSRAGLSALGLERGAEVRYRIAQAAVGFAGLIHLQTDHWVANVHGDVRILVVCFLRASTMTASASSSTRGAAR